MKIPTQNSNEALVPERMATLSFLVTGMAFHVFMVSPICMYSWSIGPTSLGTLALVAAVFSFYVSIYATVSPLRKPQRLQWFYLHMNIIKMHDYRRKCLHLYQMQGFPKWRWYALHWVGPLWMIASMFTFACINSQKGAWGYCWQVLLVGVYPSACKFNGNVDGVRRQDPLTSPSYMGECCSY